MLRPTAWRKIINQPGYFTLQVLRAFQKNQRLLLSGALAYFILLSVIPFSPSSSSCSRTSSRKRP